MHSIWRTIASFVALGGLNHALAQFYVLEPDDYPNGTVLTTVLPQVRLGTTLSDNIVVPLFTVTATDDSMHYAPTGVRVFAHTNIPFWISDRRMRMDFDPPVAFVRLAFAGGTAFDTDFGRLEIYDAADQLLDTYVTGPRGPGEVEEMQLVRPAGDIAYAIAYSVPGGGPYGPFGRLDHLVFGPFMPGDVNCDSHVDFGDINAFVLALTSPSAYQQQYPNCDIRLADANGDGSVDFGDINPFVALLSGG